ncbi:hypothetical protein WME73_19290 [Sorangium sp. So ce302]|uniref:hypothetical protein n=1 Tax=Sorangium sp. So ce302 TaxID=3133297 RepID=UPI003F63013C
MAEQDARGALAVARQEGHESGERSGKSTAILAFLAARGVSVSAEARARIEVCKEPATLDRWSRRAATAASVEEVLAEPSDPG